MPVGKKKWAGSGFWGSGPNGGGKRAGGAVDRNVTQEGASGFWYMRGSGTDSTRAALFTAITTPYG